jgi:hypothetical protein
MVFSFLYLAVRAVLGALVRSRRGLDLKAWGAQIRPSCCSGVFVDESAESVASMDLVGGARVDDA